MWWGYEHILGSIQTKPFHPWFPDDIEDAKTSPFVKRVFGPFGAKTREEAISIIQQLMQL